MKAGHGHGAQYAYFIKDSKRYLLQQMFLRIELERESRYRYGNVLDIVSLGVIPIFRSTSEFNDFMQHILVNKENFKSDYDSADVSRDVYTGSQYKTDPRIEQSLKVGQLLVEWLDEWRKDISDTGTGNE